jgi:Na+-translocating ferredoxin:NAD+ oxidoreductase subunit G
MKPLQESLAMASVLLLIVLLSTAILSLTHSKTSPIIEQDSLSKAEAVSALIFPESDETVDRIAYKEVFKDKALIGFLVESGVQGYSSEIVVIAGFNADRSIRSVVILSQQETPGLGTKIEDVSFLRQFQGLEPADSRIRKEGGSIDAVTGATASSRAVADAVRIASEAIP